MSTPAEPADRQPTVSSDQAGDLSKYRQQLGELWSRYEALFTIVQDLEQRLSADYDTNPWAAGSAEAPGEATDNSESPGSAQAAQEIAEEVAEPPAFASLQAWVSQYFAPLFVRPLESASWSWCSRWWDHPEAVLRLYGLWTSWEEMRTEPGGISNWLRDHLDHHQPILMGADGPFARCNLPGHGRPARHNVAVALGIEPPPPGDPVWGSES